MLAATGARVKRTAKLPQTETERSHSALAKRVIVDKKGTPLETLVHDVACGVLSNVEYLSMCYAGN